MALADDLVSFLKNFKGVQSLTLMAPGNAKFVKSRFLLDRVKLKCAPLLETGEPGAAAVKLRLLILERETDLSTPALLDLHYEPLLSDVLQVDFGAPVKGEKSKVLYNESSKLYEKYRYTFINHVMERMPNELKEFRRKYKDLIERDSGNINNALMSVGQHNQEISDIKLHIKHTKALDEWMSGQDILGGLTRLLDGAHAGRHRRGRAGRQPAEQRPPQEHREDPHVFGGRGPPPEGAADRPGDDHQGRQSAGWVAR